MNEYVNLLDKAASDPISALHRYRTLAAQGIGVHLFIEGEADRYLYPSVVRARTLDRVIIHELKGYQEVLQALEDVEGLSFKQVKRLFFVDRDLSFLENDRLCLSEHLYCTPYYSVESFCYCRSVVEIVAAELDSLESDSTYIDDCWDLLRANFLEIAPLMLAFMAAVHAAREAGQRPNLNNLRFSDLGLVDGRGVAKRKGRIMSAMFTQVNIDPSRVPIDRYRHWKAEISGYRDLEWFRGKYLAELITQTLKKFFGEKRHGIPRNRKGRKFKGRVVSSSSDDLLKDCLPRIRVPSCLDAYVKKRLNI
jgi:hypothetical protein